MKSESATELPEQPEWSVKSILKVKPTHKKISLMAKPRYNSVTKLNAAEALKETDKMALLQEFLANPAVKRMFYMKMFPHLPDPEGKV